MKGAGTRRGAILDTSRPTGRGTFSRRTVTGDLREQAGHRSNPGREVIHCPKGIAGDGSREKDRKKSIP